MDKKTTRTRKTPARKPVQSRGIKTREKIIQAGEKLFTRHGFHAILADDIAKEAGVSVGSFYAYFHDKRDLFLLILERYTTETTAVVSEWSRRVTKSERFDLEAFTRQALEMSVASHETFSALFREATQMALYDEAVRKRLATKDMVVRQLFEGMLMRVNASLEQPTIQTIAYVLYHASEGVIHEIVHAPESDMKTDKIIAELSRLFTCYLHIISQDRQTETEKVVTD
jgi:AcrR family transcriptional regulator